MLKDGCRTLWWKKCISLIYAESPRARLADNPYVPVGSPGMKLRDVIRMLTDDGWVKVSQKGSHRQYKHATKRGKVTVPGNLSEDVPAGTYKSILRQAGLEERE